MWPLAGNCRDGCSRGFSAMSISRPWPLSQHASKSNGTCSVLVLDLTKPHWALGPLVVQLQVPLFIPPVLQLTHSLLRLLSLKVRRFPHIHHIHTPPLHGCQLTFWSSNTFLSLPDLLLLHICHICWAMLFLIRVMFIASWQFWTGPGLFWWILRELVIKRHNVASTVKKRLTSLPESSTAQWPASLDDCVPISTRQTLQLSLIHIWRCRRRG